MGATQSISFDTFFGNHNYLLIKYFFEGITYIHLSRVNNVEIVSLIT